MTFMEVKITNLRGGFNANILVGNVEHEIVKQKPDEEMKVSGPLDLGQYCISFEDSDIDKETLSSELSSTTSETYSPATDDSIKLEDESSDGEEYGYGPILACIVLALVLIGIVLGVLFLIRKRRANENGNVTLIQKTDWLETNSIPVKENKMSDLKNENDVRDIYKVTINQEADE